MAADQPTPLCTLTELQRGAFADLTRSFEDDALDEILAEATRACETETSRRLAPFTVTENTRAEGIDPDEMGALGSGIPLDLMATLGASYASALGAGTNLVRRFWLHEHAPLYPEMWTYSGVSVSITLSIGGTQTAPPMAGPFPDTGMCWFRLGTFVPPGSLVSVTYSGGYSTVPADLRRAAKYMAAAICLRELSPDMAARHGHDAGSLEAQACSWLSPYVRAA